MKDEKPTDLKYNEYLFEQYIHHQDFIQDVTSFRLKWDMPKEGFKDGEDFEKWEDNFFEEEDMYLNDANNKQDSSPFAYFNLDQDKILNQLPVELRLAARSFIKFNRVIGIGPTSSAFLQPYPEYEFKPSGRLGIRAPFKEGKWCFIFKDNTTLDDLEDALEKYRELKGIKVAPNRKVSLDVNLKVLKRVSALSKDIKMTNSQIATIINQEFQGAEGFKSKTYKDIADIKYSPKKVIDYKKIL